jgi:hypothetical protein
MAISKEIIQSSVPPGFPPMSLPTIPSTRFSNSDIILALAKEEDLVAIVRHNASYNVTSHSDLTTGRLTASLNASQPYGGTSSSPYKSVHHGRPQCEARCALQASPRTSSEFRLYCAKVNDEFAGAAGWELQYAASRCTVV